MRHRHRHQLVQPVRRQIAGSRETARFGSRSLQGAGTVFCRACGQKALNSRIVPIIRKEILHILRDKRTLAIMLIIPLVEMLLFGYAVTTDIKHLPLAVLDQDRSAQSRDLVDAYRVSSVFDINAFVTSEEELARLIDSGEARAGLIIADAQVGRVRVGQAATVRVDSFPGESFRGEIVFVSSRAEFTPKNVQTQKERVNTVFAVRVALSNPEMKLKPGMPADAAVQVD